MTAFKCARWLFVFLPFFLFSFSVFSESSEISGLQEEQEELEQPEEIREASPGEALDMITLRMKSLSACLGEIPEPPEFNQTLDLPVFGSASPKKSQKETKE